MGTWTALTNQPTFSASTMLLLTDGTVMCQQEYSKSWWRLTPDAFGSYVQGTWSPLADMHDSRLYYASAVFRDGRVVVAGGEDSNGSENRTDLTEIYDPVADTWTNLPRPGLDGNLGDAAACVLADGRMLVGTISDTRSVIYDPIANNWTFTGNMSDRSNEESWTLLPDGSVVTVSCAGHPAAERYIPSSGQWISAGSTPVELVQASSLEIGPSVLMYDGRVFVAGATGHTAVYTPPGNNTDTGTWAAGPDFPKDTQGHYLKAKDSPGCVLPNGRVLLAVGPAGDGASDWPKPAMFFEFDGTALNRVADPGNANDGNVYNGRMLLLPTGEVLYVAGTAAMYAYQPDPGGQASWKPAITSYHADVHPGVSYVLYGRQFNGLTQGAYYGDDAQMATNYPLVRLRDPVTGKVTYCHTRDHSTMGVATGSAIVDTTFTVPASMPIGQYQLAVVANGIASDEVAVTVDRGSGRAQYVLVDRYDNDTGTLWAYVDSQWLARSIDQGELVGVAQDVFASEHLDVWWNDFEVSITRGWKSY